MSARSGVPGDRRVSGRFDVVPWRTGCESEHGNRDPLLGHDFAREAGATLLADPIVEPFLEGTRAGQRD